MLDRLKRRLRALLRRDEMERELDEELRYHLEREVERNVAGGMDAEEARAAARRSFGGIEQAREQCREARGVRLVEDLWQDLRYGLRVLRRSPSFTAVAVLSLALGIGANAAIFSVIDALMLRTLPVRGPERLVTFEQVFPDKYRQYNFSYLDMERLRSLDQVFSGISATSWADGYNVTTGGAGGGVDGGLARVSLVTGNYFSVLGVDAGAGRTLTEDDDRAMGQHPVVVISDGYWERRFGRAADVLGRTLTLNNTIYTIIGVTPQGFAGDWVGWPTDLWIPTAMISQVRPELGPGQPRSRLQYKIIARLQPGVTIQQAQAASEVLYQQLQKEPPPNTGVSAQGRLEVVSMARGYSPQREFFAPPLAILMAVVGAVLLIACANVANLLLARSAARQREMAVRLALGAGRGRVVRQLLTESVLLATTGGALGLLFFTWGTSALATLARSGPVGTIAWTGAPAIDLDLRPDARILAFTAVLCLLTGLLFGLAPAFRGSKVSLAPTLARRGAGAGGSGRGLSLLKLLVVSQVVLSLVLLVGTGLFVRTLSNLKSEELGFDRQHLLLVWTLPGQTGRQGQELASFWETVQERVSSLPGVVSASTSVEGLLGGGPTGGPLIRVEGSAPNADEDTRVQATMTVGPRFFETVGQRLLEGREFTRRDTDSAPPVVIINEGLARHFFGGESPVGRRLMIANSDRPPLEIVGVVKDVRHNSPRATSGTILYYPSGQNIRRLSRSMCLAVRVNDNPNGVAGGVRQELRNIDEGLPVIKIDTVEEQLNDVLFQERLITKLSVFFGALAVLLACVGLYGVISYSVARRTNEIGIRLALGATPAGVRWMVIKESLSMVLVGVVLGVPAALAAARLISASLYGVSSADPLTIAVATSLLVAVAALAGLLPARRASRVDPMTALRYE